jgi:hypothetical protein
VTSAPPSGVDGVVGSGVRLGLRPRPAGSARAAVLAQPAAGARDGRPTRAAPPRLGHGRLFEWSGPALAREGGRKETEAVLADYDGCREKPLQVTVVTEADA